MPDEEEHLIDRACNADRHALEELLKRQGPGLRGVLAGRLPARHQSVLDVDDVMQVTYLEAFLKIGGFQSTGPASFSSWLRAIAEHNLLDAIRELDADKRPNPVRRVNVCGEDSSAALFEVLTGSSTSPSGQTARREAKELLERAIAKLPDDYAAVVRNYDLQGLGVMEVAAAMGRSVGAIYMLRARAHDRLRELLPSASKILPK